MKKIIFSLLFLSLLIGFVSAETYFFEDFQNTTLNHTLLQGCYLYYGKENLMACYIQSAQIYIDKRTESGNNYLDMIWTYDMWTGNYDSITFNKSMNVLVDNTTTLYFKGRQNQSGVNHQYNQARFIFHFTDGSTGNILVGTNFSTNYLYEQCVLPQEDILNNTDKIVVVNLKDFTDRFNKTEGECNFIGKTIDSFAFRYSLSGVQTDYLLDDINLSSSCTIPVTNMTISTDTTFCSGNYSVTNIFIDTPNVVVTFNDTNLFAPESVKANCCDGIIAIGYDNTTIDCKGGLLDGEYSVNYDENSVNGTFGVNIGNWFQDIVLNTTIKNCEISGNLFSIAGFNWTKYGVYQGNNIHDNEWQFFGGGDYAVITENKIDDLRVNGKDMIIMYNDISNDVELGEPSYGEGCDDKYKYSGLFSRNNVTNQINMNCPYYPIGETSENNFDGSVSFVEDDVLYNVSFIKNKVTFLNAYGCNFAGSDFNISGNEFQIDGTCVVNSLNSNNKFYFYNNSVAEVIDNTNNTFGLSETNHVNYCVKKDGEFMGNYMLYDGFLEGLPYFTGSCNPVLSNYSPSIVFENETNLCFDFYLNYDNNNIIGMFNTNTSTNYNIGTFDNTGDIFDWYGNYTTCVNLADAGVTAGDYYFYMGIPDSFYGEIYPYPFVVLGDCIPNWSCNGYATCIVNEQACNSVEDLNTCGETYSGDYSEFTPQSCSPITGYTPAHVSSDIASVVVDFFVEFWIQIIAFVGLIALVGLGVWLMAVL